jgi:hypothetical protein
VICTLYEKEGGKIFPMSLLCNPLRYGGGAFRPAYNGRGLDEVLEKEFQTKRLGDAKKRLLITAFNGGSRTLKLFDSDKPSDKEYLMRDVVRASCAAPVYLPAKDMEVDALTDQLGDLLGTGLPAPYGHRAEVHNQDTPGLQGQQAAGPLPEIGDGHLCRTG